MSKKTIKDINVKDKKVLLRVDFNVPVKGGKITDDNRIKESVPTIKYLLENGAKLIVVSHLGRPDGKIMPEYSLKPCADRLSELLGQEVKMSSEVVGKTTTKLVKELKSGEVLLLENLRYLPDEEENTPEFCEKLAKLADIYVNDAFGTAHRKHASTYGVAKLLPSAVGFLIEKEINMIVKNIEEPKRPFVAILGGAKVSDKLTIVESLVKKVNTIIIGGAMAYTFLKAQGFEVGKSLVENDMIDTAKNLLKLAEEKGVSVLLPQDHVVVNNFDNPTEIMLTREPDMPEDFIGVDIGKLTIKTFTKAIKDAQLIIWNGPMGVFEKKEFAKGTYKVASAVAKSKAISIVGGGDSASAVINMGFEKKITHISTGGGASLKLFEGKVLPGIDAIENL